jgi:hypothetical protein
MQPAMSRASKYYLGNIPYLHQISLMRKIAQVNSQPSETDRVIVRAGPRLNVIGGCQFQRRAGTLFLLFLGDLVVNHKFAEGLPSLPTPFARCPKRLRIAHRDFERGVKINAKQRYDIIPGRNGLQVK